MEAQTGSLLRLRGLPFAANVDDVKDFFADYGVEEVSLLQKSGEWIMRLLGRWTSALASLACRKRISRLWPPGWGGRTAETQ